MTRSKIPINADFINLVNRIDAGEILQKDAAAMLNVTPAALCQRIQTWRLSQPPESLDTLSPQRQIFAMEKARGATNIAAARVAYPDAKESSLPVLASKVMAEPDTQVAIADLLARHGLTKSYRVSRLRQCVDSADLNVTLKALDTSFKLDGSYSPERISVTTEADIQALIAAIDTSTIPIEAETIE